MYVSHNKYTLIKIYPKTIIKSKRMIKKKFRAEVISEEARKDIGFGKIEALF